jgi:hypothetical protein
VSRYAPPCRLMSPRWPPWQASAEAWRRGAVQAVVVTAHLDQPKRQALRACGLEVASEWWVTPQALLHGPRQDTDRR